MSRQIWRNRRPKVGEVVKFWMASGNIVVGIYKGYKEWNYRIAVDQREENIFNVPQAHVEKAVVMRQAEYPMRYP